jgi:apolipoprotein N-acyltransferase
MGSENRSTEFLRFLAVVATTAVLVWFGNGLMPWWPLMWIAPFPVLWYSLHSSYRLTAFAGFLGWLFGSVNMVPLYEAQGVPLLSWLADFGGLAIIFAAGALLFRTLVLGGAVWSGVAALPALWVSVDWLRYLLTPHGTSADLAYTQLRFLPFLQLASLTGPWGMTFVLLWVPAGAAAFFFFTRQKWNRAKHVAWLVSGVLLTVLAFGTVRLLTTGQRTTMTVGLIACDAAGKAEIAAAGPDATSLLAAYAEQANILAQHGATVIVMPEKIAAVRDRDQAADDVIFQRTADAAQVTMVAGELHLSPGADRVRKYNRAEAYAPHATVVSYDKEHMLPPFESQLTCGTEKLSLKWEETTLGVAICKDMDFTSMSRGYGQLGVGLMLVPAWDFKLDRIWHGHMAIMRGVEGGFSMARAARDGYLTVSDDRGRVLAETRSNSGTFATLLAQAPVGHEPTLFQAWGNWFAWFAVVVLGIVLIRAGFLLVRFSARRCDRKESLY